MSLFFFLSDVFLDSDYILIHKKLSWIVNIIIINLNSDADAEKSAKDALRTHLTSKTFPAVLRNTNRE